MPSWYAPRNTQLGQKETIGESNIGKERNDTDPESVGFEATDEKYEGRPAACIIVRTSGITQKTRHRWHIYSVANRVLTS